MNQQRTGLALLARFPDVSEDAKPRSRAEETKCCSLLGSSGRWIGQAMSVKLLAGMTLFLIVGAILPFCLNQKSSPMAPPAGDNALSTWQPKQAESPTDASVQIETAGATVARRPVVQVSATSDRLPAAGEAAVHRRNPAAAIGAADGCRGIDITSTHG